MFESNQAFDFFDYFGVPYTVTPGGRGSSSGSLGRICVATASRARPRVLLWTPRAHGSTGARVARSSRVGRFRLRDFTLVAHVATDIPVSELGAFGSGWRPTEVISDERGHTVSAVWTDENGSVFLPFDPGEMMSLLWSEHYTRLGSAVVKHAFRVVLLRGYYACRPLLPRKVQLALRRQLASRQGGARFPMWPAEHSLHDLYSWLLEVATTVAGEPVPWLDPWPDGKAWALVLTHDVETSLGVAEMGLLRAVERELGYCSSWNFVPERYTVDPAVLATLRAEGCEVGVHGLRHDGRDLASRRMLGERLPAIRTYADTWGAVGFRSPATQRSWDLMPLLGFDYDSSYSDTDPYEPQPGGCCTYLPYANEDLIELPITLPQDHTLFAILQHRDGTVWREKAREIRDRGGMALVLVHPDYAVDERVAGAWRELLEEFADDPSVWQALPRDVAAWWRRRRESTPVRVGSTWFVRGPAADEARVRLTTLPLARGRATSP